MMNETNGGIAGTNIFVSTGVQNVSQHTPKKPRAEQNQTQGNDYLIELLNKQNTALQRALISLQRSQITKHGHDSLQKEDSVFAKFSPF
jgi:hypothetical protein